VTDDEGIALTKRGEILVQDIRTTAGDLMARLTALEMYGIESTQCMSVELATIARLLAADCAKWASSLAKDLDEAAGVFTALLEEED
jgi:hypothetical protein